MGYINRKIAEQIEKKLKPVRVDDSISVEALKDAISKVRIPKRDYNKIVNELENEGFITRRGNKVIIKRR